MPGVRGHAAIAPQPQIAHLLTFQQLHTRDWKDARVVTVIVILHSPPKSHTETFDHCVLMAAGSNACKKINGAVQPKHLIHRVWKRGFVQLHAATITELYLASIESGQADFRGF